MLKRITISLTALALTGVSCSKKDEDEKVATEDFSLKGTGSEDDANLASGIDPENLMMKLYGFYASKEEDCSDMVEVYTNDDPDYEDVLAGADYGKKSLEDGTWKCIAYKMSDYIKYTPSATTGACTAGEEQTSEVCRANDETGTAGVNFDDEEFSCSEGEEDVITFYVSTVVDVNNAEKRELAACQSEGEGQGDTSECTSFRKPSADKPHRGMQLADAIVKSGAMTGYIILDGSGQIESSTNNGQPYCEMQPPTFGFIAVDE